MLLEPEEEVTLDDGIARLFGVSTDSTDGIRVADIRLRAAAELTRYAEKLQSELKAVGIGVPPAIQITSLESGLLIVDPNHPSATVIAHMVNEDTCLNKWFKEVEVLFSIVRRTELRKQGQPMSNQHFNLGLTSLGPIAFFTEA